MLQTYSDFAGILNDAHARRRGHRVREGLERGQGRDVVGHVDDCKGRNRQARRADEHVADLQDSATKAVFRDSTGLNRLATGA